MGQTTGLSSGIRVLELAQRIAGPYCGKILALMGAEVIKVETAAGDEARRMGPGGGADHLLSTTVRG